MRQHIEDDIKWPEDPKYKYYILPQREACTFKGGFWEFIPPKFHGYCHAIIERPHEVCGKAWLYDAAVDKWYPGNGSACTLDAGHDGPCMMELGEAE